MDNVNRDIQGTKILFLDEESKAQTLESIPSTVKSLYIEIKIGKIPSKKEKRKTRFIKIGLTTNSSLEGGKKTAVYESEEDFGCGWITHEGVNVCEAPYILEGRVVGCSIQQLDFNGTIFVTYAFSINGENVGGRSYLEPGKFYPTVHSNIEGLEIEINFGDKPYQFPLGILYIFKYYTKV